MLTAVEVKNYRVLRDVRVGLKPFTVVVGPNGCGKTSLLSCIASLLEVCQFYGAQEIDQAMPSLPEGLRRRLEFERIASRPQGSERVTLRAERHAMAVDLAVSGGFVADQLAMTVATPRGVHKFGFFEGEFRNLNAKGRDWVESLDDFLAVMADFSAVAPLQFALHPRALASPSPASKGKATLAADGAGLATYLASLAVRGKLGAVVADLQAVVPHVRAVQPLESQIDIDAIETLTLEGQPIKRVRSERSGAWRLEFTMASGAVVSPARLATVKGRSTAVAGHGIRMTVGFHARCLA